MSNNKNVARIEANMMTAFELENIKAQLGALLENNPKKIEAFKTNILKISLSYGLDNCSPESIINCGVQALTLNLPIQAGQGYIVNYGGTATFDCGYKGWQILAKRAGFAVLADVVYACDEFNQSGFGFNREMVFNPDLANRKSSDDKWAKQHLTGVIVSIREIETGLDSSAFVPADMIHKIVATSPSQKSEKGKQYSPHEKWAEQMFCAKAIKQVLSKFPIDLAKSTELQQAIEMVNVTESTAQAQAKEPEGYSQERFDEYYPKWIELVSSGKKKAMAIITQFSNSYALTSEQLERIMDLRNHEPIEGDIADAETTESEVD